MSRTDKIKHLRKLILRTGGELIPLAHIDAELTDTEIDEEVKFFEGMLARVYTNDLTTER